MPGLVFVAYLWTGWTDKSEWVLFFSIAVKVAASIGALWVLLEFALSRRKRAMSLLFGLTLMALGTYFFSEMQFQNQLTNMDRIVEIRRASMKKAEATSHLATDETNAEPLRMIVSLEGWHGNSSVGGEFSYIVFDDTDQVESHPEILPKFLPYPGSKFAAISGNGRNSVTKFHNHYYRVIERQ